MGEIFNNKSYIDSKTLNQLLDNIITPRLQKHGLLKYDKRLWHDPTIDTIRCGFAYSLLKGEQGTFTWGVCLNFIPIPYGGKLTYSQTEKSFRFHLFEWTDEYSNSFLGGSLEKGVTTHWGLKEAEKSILALLDKYEQRIINWYNSAKTIEKLIEIAKMQSSHTVPYNIHSPDPKYILSYLYAKSKQIDKAIQLFDSLSIFNFKNNNDLREKARIKLIELANENLISKF